jgi:hypothetical protein
LGAGFTIYNGWVTAATILNVAYSLKAIGLGDKVTPPPFESTATCVVLVVAFVIYNAVSWRERNWLYGLVFVWPLLAIRAEQKDDDKITKTCTALVGLELGATVAIMAVSHMQGKERRRKNEQL